jgi:UDP-N-acetyl-D-glucosamine dehydrogenase
MPAIKESLLSKIESRELDLAIIGLGYVGLPLAVAFAEAGFRVTGIDISVDKVTSINRGQSYVEDVASDTLQPLVKAGMLRASKDYADLTNADAIIICVPTPLNKTRDPDISYIIAATEEIVRFGSSGKLMVLESTTYPGTTEEIILPRLTSNGDQVGRDFFLAFSPERIDPGRSDYVVSNTPKVVGGITKDCLDVAVALYGCVVDKPVPVSNTATAEMVKLLENTFRAVNIGLVNEMALMCDKLGLDVWEVVEAAATKPYGYMPFYPGPGLGGHCIPIDPHYLSWKLRTLNYTARFIELASEVNSHMPDHVVNKVTDALNGAAKPVNGSKILILGVAYKANVGDVRESPALDVIHLLESRGSTVCYHDPFVSDLDVSQVPAKRVELTAEVVREADCVIVITDHDGYDWSWISKNAQLIVDTRNVIKGQPNDHIVRL